MPNGMTGRVGGPCRGLGLLFCAMLIAACGGDDDGIHDGVLAAAFEGEEDQLGLFLPPEHFYGICESPRASGTPGVLLDDKPGTAVDEKNFLRSYTYLAYLWYDEVEYIDPGDAQYSVLEYFYRMRTFEITPTGRLKDEFSFAVPTELWLDLIEEGITSGYGFEDTFAVVNGAVTIFHVEPGSPADRNGLTRGARVVSVEGRTFELGMDTIEFLYPPSSITAQGALFEVLDLGSTTTRTFRMREDGYTIDPVRFTRVIDTDTGPVGYIFFSNHNELSEKELIAAFRELAEAEVADLVLDLRYNQGGLLGVAAEAAAMIAGPSATSGRVFRILQLNDKHPTHYPSGDPIEPLYFPTAAYGFSAEPNTPLPSLNLSRVFILATPFTCSASESIINGLRGIDVEVILIGDTTCGKPYGFTPVDNCGTTYLSVNYRGANAKGFGDYSDGFAPQNTTRTGGVSVTGCAVADDYERTLGDANEAQLAAALQYRSGGNCPPPSRLHATPVNLGGLPRNIDIMLMR